MKLVKVASVLMLMAASGLWASEYLSVGTRGKLAWGPSQNECVQALTSDILSETSFSDLSVESGERTDILWQNALSGEIVGIATGIILKQVPDVGVFCFRKTGVRPVNRELPGFSDTSVRVRRGPDDLGFFPPTFELLNKKESSF